MDESFGRYRLEEKLGQGGMGIVYRAFDTVLQRIIALKMVLTTEGLDPDLRERFFREARAAAHLSHRNIVTIYDLGEHDGRPYLAMEYLDGEDLQRRLARTERMNLARKLEIALEICQGIDYAHSHGIIHRDLKPANIFLTATGGVKILDFGLARLMSSQLTQSNQLMGTLNYMAPEQVRGERADQQSDVFSIGVVLYELFGGRRAFEGDSVASTLYKILQEAPQPLSKIDAGLPPELIAAIDRALAKLRDERYPDMASLRRDLEACRQSAPLSPPFTLRPATMAPDGSASPYGVPTPAAVQSDGPASGHAGPASIPAAAATAAPRRPWGLWFGAAAFVLAVMVALWAALRPRSPKPVPPTAVVALGETPVAPPPASVRAGAPSAVAAAPAAPPPAASPARGSEGSRQVAGTTPRPAPALRRTRVEPEVVPPSSSARSRLPPASLDTHPLAAPPPGAPPAPPVAPIVSVLPPAVSSPATALPLPASPAPSSITAQPAAPAASPAAIPEAPSAEQRIRDLLGRYQGALESKNIDQLKRIWPSLSGGAEQAVRQEFQHAQQIDVEIVNPQISISGNEGRVTFLRKYSLVTVDGQRLQSTTQTIMQVRRAGAAWLIDNIQFRR